MKEKNYIKIIEWTIGIVLFIALIIIVNIGIKNTEKRECQKWQEWGKEYRIFKSQDWQYKQCEQYGIELK